MPVNTKTAPRRDVSYPTLEEALADAERLAASPHETTGNWTLAEILEHLARSIEANLDGVEAKAPLPLRLFGPILKPLLKRQVTGKSMLPGFTLPKNLQAEFFPREGTTLEQALAMYREQVERAMEATEVREHPFFGQMTRDELMKLHCNHAALHLSFVRPAE